MNRQSSLFREITSEEIQTIFAHALKETTILRSELLDGGLFNTTYFVEYGASRKKAVLRLGPVNRHLIMGFEENLMEAEQYVYSVCRSIGIPCSNVLACDTSRQVIDRDYMIVAYIPSVAMVSAELTEDEKRPLYVQMGRYLKKLHQVTGDSFGFVSRLCEGMQFASWSEALLYEAEDIAARFVGAGGISPEQAEQILRPLRHNRALLDEVKTPSLLHTDLWEGNVLLTQDTHEIAAIIDCDRAVYGDVDFEFASSWMENPALKEGYGMEEHVSPARKKRRQLYRIFFCLLEGYVWYAEYNNPEIYRACMEKLPALLADVR